MLERYFVKPSTVDRIRASWLAPEIERYVEWMDLQGYAIRNVHKRVPLLCRFAEFAKQYGSTDLKSSASRSRVLRHIGWPPMKQFAGRQKPGPRSPKRHGIQSARCCSWRLKVV